MFIDEDGKEKLNKNEIQAVADKVYFKAPSIKAAGLKTYNKFGNEASSVSEGEVATFTFLSVDQNGKPYYDTKDEFVASFAVNPKTTDVVVGDVTVKAGSTKTITVDSVNGVASIKVESKTKGKVNVKASSTSPKLSTVEKTVRFVGEDDVASGYVGVVTDIVTKERTIRFEDKLPVDYTSSDKFYNEDDKSISRAKFVDTVEKALKAGKEVKVKYQEDKDNNIWTIVEVKEDASITLDNAIKAAEKLVKADYTPESWTAFEAALKAAKELPATATNAEKLAAVKALEAAEKALVEKDEETVVEGFTFTSQEAVVNKVIAQAATYNIAGTVAEEVGEVDSVVIVFGSKELPATYNAADRTFEFKQNSATQDTVGVKAYDAAGKELAATTIEIIKK